MQKNPIKTWIDAARLDWPKPNDPDALRRIAGITDPAARLRAVRLFAEYGAAINDANCAANYYHETLVPRFRQEVADVEEAGVVVADLAGELHRLGVFTSGYWQRFEHAEGQHAKARRRAENPLDPTAPF